MLNDEKPTAVIDYDYKLTDYDKLVYGQRIAELDEQDDALENERKMQASSFKARLDENHSERKKLSRAIRTGEEMKSAICEVVHDHNKVVVNFVEVATGQTVSSRPMTSEERQLPLFG